jgi:hypothetical protein
LARRSYFDFLERYYTALVADPGEILDLDWVEDLDLDLPKRRDNLTFADLGREHRGAGQMLFVREVSAAMRAIFGKPHDKCVGELAGLAFETKTLSPKTVRRMCGKTTLTRPKIKRELEHS